MDWPGPSDYDAAIQNPAMCFKDQDLKAGEVELSGELPRVRSGNYASVYNIFQGQKKWAVRCFSYPVTEQRDRYAHLNKHLSTLRLPYLTEFEYQESGILVNGAWYPIVKMEWCIGKTLHKYIEQHLNDSNLLLDMGEEWRLMINELQSNSIGHGDLQHENVIVSDDSKIKLVDYDAMFVPTLHGRQSLECGHDNFQHPGRSINFYNERVDDFAALVVYTSLRALAVNPGLWSDHHTGENLIFTSEDFSDSSNSLIWPKLERSGNRVVRELTEQLRYFCHVNIDQVTNFEKVVSNILGRSTHRKAFSLPSSSNVVSVEYSEAFEASDPQFAWSKRITLFGSGEIQGMYVKGKLPPAIENIKEGNSFNEYIFVKTDRLCLRTGEELLDEWVHADGTRGRLKLFRKEPAKEDIVAILRGLYNEKFDLLPDKIGVMGGNCLKGSIIYNCLIDDLPHHKEICFSSLEVYDLLFHKYNEAASSVKESLLDLVGEVGQEDQWDAFTEIVAEREALEDVGGVAVTAPNESMLVRKPVLTMPVTVSLFSAIGLMVTSIFIDSNTLLYSGVVFLILVVIFILFRVVLTFREEI